VSGGLAIRGLRWLDLRLHAASLAAVAALSLLGILYPCAVLAAAQNHSQLVIEALRCEGNVSTSCRFILSYVHLSPGDRLNEEELQDARLRLSWLRNFSSVDIHLETGPIRGKVIVVIKVVEATTLVSASGLGLSDIGGVISEVLYGSLSDDDLFGRGEALNLDAEARVSPGYHTQRDDFWQLQYVDPQLLDSQRYFLDAALSHRDASYDFANGEYFDERLFAADVEVGRRIGAFGYAALGYEYRPVANVTCQLTSLGFTVQSVEIAHGALTGAVGWNGDDPAFPTGGLELNARYAPDVSGCGNIDADARYTAPVGHGSYLTLHAQYPWGAGLEFAHDLASEISPEIRRARWYVEPGFWSIGYSSNQDLAGGAGVRAGLRLDTKYLGTLDLFLYVTADWHHGGIP
jgi:outer membrane protein assembly factor BamA